MTDTFDDLGIRFEYPSDWELEVDQDGPRSTVSVHAPGGVAFALISLDEDRPEALELAEQALEAMRDEYPALDARAVTETIDGREAVGFDVEFSSLDLSSACAIRCMRTESRTILSFGQWADLGEDDSESRLREIRMSLEETESVGLEEDE
jgi:hypothetical protein